MAKALYRTYRSKKLSEIVGQEHITTALEHALTKGTVSHAYLFTGPRGVGKTSIARILAHEINGLPYDEDRQHLDIIEIDAASNRRIDEIRDLRDKVHIVPSSAKYKVYIIDEVHMLTKEAFNALLKTLEEPPAHVIFILATTEVHKLPETIISRTQRYSFKPVSLPKVIAHLRHIAEEEKIAISDEALELIAIHGEGSFRDSISLLDQLRNSDKEVNLEDVQLMLGIAPTELIANIVKAMIEQESLAVAKGLKQMHEQGYEPALIALQISTVLRDDLIANKISLAPKDAIKLLSALVQVPASPDPRIALEIALLDTTLSNSLLQDKPAKQTHAKTMSEGIQIKTAIQIAPKRKVSATLSTAGSGTGSINVESVVSTLVLNEESWALILNALKKDHNTLYSVAKTAHPRFLPGKVILEFGYPFHQKRVGEAHNKKILTGVIGDVTGSAVQIDCVIKENSQQAVGVSPLPLPGKESIHTINSAITHPVLPDSSVDTISNIFGGAELLDS